MDKRSFLKTSILGMGGLIISPTVSKGGYYSAEPPHENNIARESKFDLPSLPYDYNALEPHIDARTMEIHHSRHHAAYVNNLNEALKDNPVAERSVKSIMKNVSSFSTTIRNNGGGHYNHKLFWEIMSPTGGGEPTGELLSAINSSFGSFNRFRELFTSAAATRFGSGWAWLVECDGGLKVTSTPNQDNPLMDVVPAEERGTPVLGIDVWEHAYYLKYQNRRGDYISAFWNVINWEAVSEKLKRAGN